MPSRHYTAALSSLLAATLSMRASAQTHHVAPAQKVTRAIGVLEWTGDLNKPTASRLVPVSLFINGHMEDAGLYLARPVPFALLPGDIYSVELAGEEKGTFDIEHTRDFTTGRLLADVEPVGAWYGFGRFAPLAPPKPAPALHAAAHLPVISTTNADPGRPHLGTKSADSTPPDGNSGTKSGDTSDKTPLGDDPDRPTLGRKTSNPDSGDDSSKSTAKTSSGTDTSTGSTASTDKDPERPSLRKRSAENTGKKSPPQSGVTGPERSLNDDPDRPTIRHGKTPAQEEAAELKGTPADMHQVAAVSDAANREPHVFTRPWESPTERADVLGRLQVLTRTQVTDYVAQNRLTPGTPVVPASVPVTSVAAAHDKDAPTLRRTPGGVSTPTAVTAPAALPTTPAPQPRPATGTKPGSSRARAAAHSSKTAKPPAMPITFTEEQLSSYTLTYGGLPTFVYAAQVPLTTGGPIYVTVVAQRMPSGELQIALRSITDATHLDRNPWLRPVDAVDPDWSHRASLLFELRARNTRQFALYRLVSAQAEQQFLSEPIR